MWVPTAVAALVIISLLSESFSSADGLRVHKGSQLDFSYLALFGVVIAPDPPAVRGEKPGGDEDRRVSLAWWPQHDVRVPSSPFAKLAHRTGTRMRSLRVAYTPGNIMLPAWC